MHVSLARRASAEFVGTAFLLAAIVGSGAAAARMSSDAGLQLLENAVATGAALAALIVALGPISGAHFNPAVTVAAVALGTIGRREGASYALAQVAGGVVGVMAANVMFEVRVVAVSATQRSGGHLWFAETAATLGLVLVIFLSARRSSIAVVAGAVGSYIAAAYWFTSSTGFANPAVTLARTLTTTSSGIAPGSVPPFVIAQLVGAVAAVAIIRTIDPAPAGPSAAREAIPLDTRLAGGTDAPPTLE